MMTYENAPATKLMCSNCVICGRPLVDAISVQMGIGPCCRHGFNAGISPEVQKLVNTYIYHASLAAQKGHVDEVLYYAKKIDEQGLSNVASKIVKRYEKVEDKVEITITVEQGMYRVTTPFRRGARKEFVNAWQQIPERRWILGANYIPLSQKPALIVLLRTYFPNKYGKGPKGIFRLEPMPNIPVQSELAIEDKAVKKQ